MIRPSPPPRNSHYHTLSENAALSEYASYLSVMSSALAVLEELHRSNPNADSVSLRGLGLERLDNAALTFLADKLPSLRTLDVSENSLTNLPSDFGVYVPRLVALDLRENAFYSIPELSEVLALCSSLQSLSISLRNKTDEKILRVMLPKLQLLNGTPMKADEELEEAIGRSPLSLDLALSPTSSSSGSIDFDSPTLRWLDTPPSRSTKNHSAIRPVRSPQEKRELRLQFAAAQETQKPSERKATSPKRGLSVRPTELPATISDDRTDWRKLLKNTKPLAGSGTDDADVKPKSKSETSRQGEDDRSSALNTTGTRAFIAELKAIVKSFHKRPAGKATAEEQHVLDQLDHKIDMLALQLNDLEKKPRNSGDKASPMDGHVVTASLAARWRLLEAGTTYAAQKAHSIDKSLGAGLLRLTQTQTQVVEALLRHVNDAIYAQQKWQAASTSQEQVAGQQKQQMKLLLDVAETLEKDLEALQTKFQHEKTEKEQAQAASQSLQTECEELRKKLSERQEERETTTVPSTAVANPNGRIRKRTETKSAPRLASPTATAKPTVVVAKSPPVPSSPPRTQPGIATAPRSQSPPKAMAPMRCLTLKQLVDLIHCILTSKSKYDARIQAIGAPPETVEQHMYTYLNQRFGLQTLIVEYASAIWKGCQMYTRHDNDVAMFHAMMRNQVDEDFVGIKKKLQQAIRELLRAYFLAKYPMKQETVIQKMVEARLLGGLIQEEEWTELLLYLYDPSDSSILMRLVKRKAESFQREQQQQQQQLKAKSTKATQAAQSAASALPFAIFEKLLCDYQLQGRLKLLEGFRQLFGAFDSERVGVVSRDLFREVVAQVAPRKSDSEVDKMMQRIDPFEHDTITFSDAVRCLLQDIRQHSVSRRTAAAHGTTTDTVHK